MILFSSEGVISPEISPLRLFSKISSNILACLVGLHNFLKFITSGAGGGISLNPRVPNPDGVGF